MAEKHFPHIWISSSLTYRLIFSLPLVFWDVSCSPCGPLTGCVARSDFELLLPPLKSSTIPSFIFLNTSGGGLQSSQTDFFLFGNLWEHSSRDWKEKLGWALLVFRPCGRFSVPSWYLGSLHTATFSLGPSGTGSSPDSALQWSLQSEGV